MPFNPPITCHDKTSDIQETKYLRNQISPPIRQAFILISFGYNYRRVVQLLSNTVIKHIIS